jgi:hypothetical protein
MPKIQYKSIKMRAASLAIVEKCNAVLAKYEAAGYDMTLRQLYYQLVAADEIPNTPASYNNLGSLVNDARLAGLIDWDLLVDRTRNLQSIGHWESPSSIMAAVASQYATDKWSSQSYRPEVWIEKEALAGVFERICNELDVPFFACRGYTSQSEMWRAARRLASYERNGQSPIILHFGDHDPSGVDMTRDIIDRLALFMGGVEVNRLALNMDQVDLYAPPPNPAKITDSRATVYIQKFGRESWELDALEPDVLADLVREAITNLLDPAEWQTAVDLETKDRETLQAISTNFRDVRDHARQRGWLQD